MKHARVLGAGVAALCCARVLLERGWTVTLEAGSKPRLPRVVLNSQTAALLGQVFGRDEPLWGRAHSISRRRVAWGGGPPAEIEEHGVVLSGRDLIGRLRARLLARHGGRLVEADEADFVVTARGRPSAGSHSHRRCGDRKVLAAEVALSPSADQSAAVVETTPRGWLFLIPGGAGAGTVQAMVAEVSGDPRRQLLAMLSDSRLIARQLGGDPGGVLVFDGAPSMSTELCRRGWIAVGDEAISLDPLCGDGTGYGVRGAILASCVIDGIANGVSAEPALAHYRARLATTFAAHLRACLSFYDSARFDASWAIECDAGRRELSRLNRSLMAHRDFSFGVSGFKLVPRNSGPPSEKANS